MTAWEQLAEQSLVVHHSPSKVELDHLREVVARDLKDAACPGLSDDRRFATAYDAVVQIGRMAIACAGYRVPPGPSYNKVTIEALALAMGPSIGKLTAYFDTCRPKRMKLEDETAGVVSRQEADELIRKAKEFRKLFETWVIASHPRLSA